jgi:hypothetical protein
VSDLTKEEQANVRAALVFLRARCGSWANVAKALKLGESSPGNIVSGHATAGPLVVFRIAKFAKVGVDDVLTGSFPPAGTCPHCGHARSPAA